MFKSPHNSQAPGAQKDMRDCPRYEAAFVSGNGNASQRRHIYAYICRAYGVLHTLARGVYSTLNPRQNPFKNRLTS